MNFRRTGGASLFDARHLEGQDLPKASRTTLTLGIRFIKRLLHVRRRLGLTSLVNVAAAATVIEVISRKSSSTLNGSCSSSNTAEAELSQEVMSHYASQSLQSFI